MADGTIDKLTISIGASSAKAVTSINKLAEAFREMRTALSVIDSQSADKISRLAISLHQLKDVGSLNSLKNLPTNLTNIAIAVGSISENTISRLDRLTTALQKLKGVSLSGAGSLLDKNSIGAAAAATPAISGQDAAGGGTASGGLEAVAEKAKSTTSVLDRLKTTIHSLGSSFWKMGHEAQKSTGPLGSLLAAFKRIAMYRVLRSIIKAITQAFQEGLQNAYTFSQSIEGEGHRFAAAMDTMKSAGLTMKNQLGSAFIGLLAAIQPIITTIINLVTSLANAMSQFFAVFTGGTYLKAQDTTAQMASNMAGGAKAAKEWKNQLLGFDVINRLEAPSDGGGGGGGGLADAAGMFKDTEIDGIFKKMRDALVDLKNSLNFEPLIKSWERLKEAIKGFADVVLGYFAMGWEKILVPLAHWVIEEAAPQLVELLAAAFEFLSTVLEKLQPLFDWLLDHVIQPLTEWLENIYLDGIKGLTEVLETLTRAIGGDSTLTVEEFFTNMEDGLNRITYFTNPLIALGDALGNLLSEKVSSAIEAVKACVDKTVEEVKETIENAKELIKNVINNLKEAFQSVKTSITNVFYSIKNIVSNVIDSVVNMIQNMVSHIRGALSVVGSLGGLFGGFHMPQFASGGFPEDGLFMANHGELVGKFANGKTAVANNEEITAGIARAVYDAFTAAISDASGSGGSQRKTEFVFNLNGREFARAIYNDQQAVSQEHGVSYLASA